MLDNCTPGMDFAYNLIITVLGLAVMLYFWKFMWCQRKILAVANQLPCPLKIPILGNTYMVLGGIDRIVKMTNERCAEFGGMFCVWLGPVPVFVVYNPEDLKIILHSNKTLEKHDGYGFFKPLLGDGLITAPAKIWKRTRRVLNPVFNHKNIEDSLTIFNKTSKKLVEKLSDVAVEKERSISRILLIYFAEVVTRSVLGLKEEFSDAKVVHYITNLMSCFRPMELGTLRVTRIYLAFDCIFNYMYKKEMEECKANFERVVHELNNEGFLTTRRERKSEENGNGTKSTKDCQNPNISCDESAVRCIREVLLDLMESDPTFTEKDFMYEIITILIAGSDTSRNLMGFCLLSLANYQEIQEKLYSEVKDIFGDSDRDVTMEDIKNMPYLDCVVKESLRRYRILPYIGRKSTEDIKLTTCTLPAGSTIMINLNGLHMDPSIYPNPKVFDPERFTPDKVSQRHPYSFLPFSGGQRSCIGNNFAMAVMKVTLVNIIKRFKLSTTRQLEDIVYKISLTMGSKNGFPINFHHRE